MLPIETQVFVPHEGKLTVDHKGGDDEKNSDQKLKDHKAVAKRDAAPTAPPRTTEELNRAKGGQEEGGVTSGKNTDRPG